MSQVHKVCPKPAYGMMPLIIHDAAMKGNETKVMSWLDKGGDINASDMNDRTLVFLACENNHPYLLKKLLKHPEVHLNQEAKDDGYTPFSPPYNTPCGLAICKGHVECVDALLASQSSCLKLNNLNSYAFGSFPSYLMLAVSRNQWQVVEAILKTDVNITNVVKVLEMAIRANEIGIIQDILKRDISLEPQRHQTIFQELYKTDQWDESGIEAHFKKVCKNTDPVKKFLSLVLKKKDWKKLEYLLEMIVGSVTIKADLAEAVIGGNAEDLKFLVQEDQDEEKKKDAMNGVLLTASIGGTSEEVVQMLLDPKFEYPAVVLRESLLLACLNSNVELLPELLQRCSFSYKILSRARDVAGNNQYSKLIERALKKSAQEIIHLE